MVKAPQFLKQFSEASKYFTLSGNRMLVERIDISTEIKSKTSNLIISTGTGAGRNDLKNHMPLLCYVLAVGEGYTEEGSDVKTPLDCKPGNVVMLNSMGVSFFSTLPGVSSYSEMKVGLTSEGDVQLRFNTIEEFQAYAKALSEGE